MNHYTSQRRLGVLRVAASTIRRIKADDPQPTVKDLLDRAEELDLWVKDGKRKEANE